MKNVRTFIRKFSVFLEVKFSTYANRRVFVMTSVDPEESLTLSILAFWINFSRQHIEIVFLFFFQVNRSDILIKQFA